MKKVSPNGKGKTELRHSRAIVAKAARDFDVSTRDAIGMLVKAAKQKRRNLQMPGDGRYQPSELKPYLGYDQWAGWLIIVEWFWMVALARLGVMPRRDAFHLKRDVLAKLIKTIVTTDVDTLERSKTKHDILALLALMRELLPKPLHRWLHFGATSYDIIETAYSLQFKYAFHDVTYPLAMQTDEFWRRLMLDHIGNVRAGMTHLQTALPVTVGFWLAGLHHRFYDAILGASAQLGELQGKFSGAVGTKASQYALGIPKEAEVMLMKILGLEVAPLSTQILPPEQRARCYFELVLLSGALANLGEDARILQSTRFGEVMSMSSTSSAMSHKKGNPILAEQDAGMHTTVVSEFMRVALNLVSDLERDLRNSSPMRGYTAVLVYTHQQLVTARRLLQSMSFDLERIEKNFGADKFMVVAELLHLALQRNGLPDAHAFVNAEVVPLASRTGRDLVTTMNLVLRKCDRGSAPVRKAWAKVPADVRRLLRRPESYIGRAMEVVLHEVKTCELP